MQEWRPRHSKAKMFQTIVNLWQNTFKLSLIDFFDDLLLIVYGKSSSDEVHRRRGEWMFLPCIRQLVLSFKCNHHV